MTLIELLRGISHFDRSTPRIAVRQFGLALTFDGRSTRAEFISYWVIAIYATMALALIGLVSALGDFPTIRPETLFLIWKLLFVPIPSLLVRRLHDQDRSGAWAIPLLIFWAIPLLRTYDPFAEPDWVSVVGGFASISMLIALLWPGAVGANKFGADPQGSRLGAA